MRPLFHAIDLRRLDIVKALHSSTKSHASNDLDLNVSMRVVLNHPEDIRRLYPAHTGEHKSSKIEFEDTPALLYAVLHAPDIAMNLIGSGNWLCENAAGITPIIACAMQGEAQLLGQILQKSDVRTNKGPINKTCQTHHMTALAHAIKHGHKQCVELLLQQPQIDPNKAPTGLMPNPCPLMLAIELGAIESAIKLIEHKDTDLNTTDRYVVSNGLCAVSVYLSHFTCFHRLQRRLDPAHACRLKGAKASRPRPPQSPSHAREPGHAAWETERRHSIGSVHRATARRDQKHAHARICQATVGGCSCAVRGNWRNL